MKTTVIKNMKNFSLVAIIMASIIFAACSGDENIISEPPAAKTYTLIVNASKGDVTRALSLDGTTLKATWTMGDAVTVYNVTRSTDLGGKLIAQRDGQSTTLSGTLTGTIKKDDVLKLKFLSPSYSSQDGTLAGIATTCDYAEATVSVTAVSESSITTSDATFTNQQSIVKFTLKDKSTDAALNATSMTVNAGATTINVTPASATDVLYVAIPGITSQNVSLSATASGTVYTYEKSGVTLDNGKYYGFTVSMTADLSASIPLTFEAMVKGVEVTFKKGNFVANQIEYSIDGGSTWNEYDKPIILPNVGSKVSFRGDNAAYGSSSSCSKFSCTNSCYVYGNIMSLINPTEYATTTILTADYTFARLFENNTNIRSHSTNELKLPATTLKDNCYRGMFAGCNSLTIAPELPATTLASYCYSGMFNSCSKLTVAPSLPATTLTTGCYCSMFSYCKALTVAPKLPATTLAEDCYETMFQYCDNLTTPPELPATTLTPRCYEMMFRYCHSLTTAPELPATTLTEDCYYQMFDGCTSLTTAPELPATTLAVDCYQQMFSYTGLTTAPELPATTLASYCYYQMFEGCKSLTTAPELPATTLSSSCYFRMFKDCTSLTTAPDLPATTLAERCYSYMFDGCTNLTVAPSLPATTLVQSCYDHMFIGCTSLTTAPDLPATTLISYCYQYMFQGCTSLNKVKCLATDISASECTTDWLQGVSAIGTFTKASSMTSWPSNSPSGIPSGWAVENE